jgi:L-alanine-DL-glutamate epimerase-like enolase superfamily enzyme
MQRRDFLKTALSTTLLATILRAAEAPPDLKVTRAVGFQVTSRRNKVAGRNARLDVHGDLATDRLVRLYTNQKVEGIGHCRAAEKEIAQLLGKNPLKFHNADQKAMTGPLGAGTMPLWDLAGKVLKQPVYRLLGGRGPEKPATYDASIYFADLLPEFAGNWQDRFRAEIEMGLKLGHRAFKIKIGRGSKWMPRAQGDARDLEVVRLIRQHAGPNARLMVDANCGYDLIGAKRFLEKAAIFNLTFVEEMFPETIDECLALKEFIKSNGWKILVADGESQHELDGYKPYIEAKAIDVLQGDMNHFGIEGILTEAAWAEAKQLLIAPHNWGSFVGYFMETHIARAVPNCLFAEHDPLTNDVLRSDGYSIQDGCSIVPDSPGFGLAINEAKFASEAKVLFDLKA